MMGSHPSSACAIFFFLTKKIKIQGKTNKKPKEKRRKELLKENRMFSMTELLLGLYF